MDTPLTVEANLGLVRMVARRVWGGAKHLAEFDELVNEGVFGLHQAIERFEPGKGYKFSSFASAYIRGAILHYLRDGCTPGGLTYYARAKNKTYVKSLDERLSDYPELTILDTLSDDRELEIEEYPVWRYVDTLPYEIQQTIRLCYCEGLTQKQAAQLLGVVPMTIGRRHRKGLKLLRRRLDATTA